LSCPGGSAAAILGSVREHVTSPARRDRLRELLDAGAADEGWSSPAVFSWAFRRTFGVPPSRARDVGLRVPAPNGLHLNPPAVAVARR
jgi:hypothetical protein